MEAEGEKKNLSIDFRVHLQAGLEISEAVPNERVLTLNIPGSA